jgi:BolA protein
MQHLIETRLTEAFSPVELQVIDDSEAHRGHAGYREGGNTHFTVIIRAEAFNGLSRVAAQRLVYAQLKEAFDKGLHALALTVSGTRRGGGS